MKYSTASIVIAIASASCAFAAVVEPLLAGPADPDFAAAEAQIRKALMDDAVAMVNQGGNGAISDLAFGPQTEYFCGGNQTDKIDSTLMCNSWKIELHIPVPANGPNYITGTIDSEDSNFIKPQNSTSNAASFMFWNVNGIHMTTDQILDFTINSRDDLSSVNVMTVDHNLLDSDVSFTLSLGSGILPFEVDFYSLPTSIVPNAPKDNVYLTCVFSGYIYTCP
eukprot:Clim_evm7s75 gene=Clim_evmTU7s75